MPLVGASIYFGSIHLRIHSKEFVGSNHLFSLSKFYIFQCKSTHLVVCLKLLLLVLFLKRIFNFPFKFPLPSYENYSTNKASRNNYTKALHSVVR